MTKNQSGQDQGPRSVVVGIDESAAARAALSWAARQARMTQQQLKAVHVREWPFAERLGAADAGLHGAGLAGAGVGGMGRAAAAPAHLAGLESLTGEAQWDRTDAGDALDTIQQLFDQSRPEEDWILEIVGGDHVGTVLLERSVDADLLVVGTGEHTGLGRLLAGSVSHYCLSHAEIPVTAVPAPS